MKRAKDWIWKRWMLLGIAAARVFPGLRKWKYAVGDRMVLACTLTLPTRPDGTQWPGGKPPLLVMFRPPIGSQPPFELWATDDPTASEEEFEKVEGAEAAPLFGGKLYAFVTDNLDRPTRYFVRTQLDGKTIDSGVVVSKIDRGLSRFEPDILKVEGSAPTFQWPEVQDPNHWINFLVLADGEDLILGVYTQRSDWTFPMWTDLPYTINDPSGVKPLTKGKTYRALYHPVDADGWVETVAMREFQA